MIAVLLSFCGAFLTVFLVTPSVMKLAIKWHVLDTPSGHKTHSQPVPYLGGIAIFSAVLMIVLVWIFTDTNAQLVLEVLVVAGVSTLMAGLGLLDDLRNLTPKLRLVVEFIGASLISVFAVSLDFPIPSVVNHALTIIWVVVVVNAVNMLDHQDGLAAGTTAISALAFTVISLNNHQSFVPILCAGLGGASIAFLRTNFHPAKIYMGDSGAYLIGVLLAYAGIKTNTSLPQSLSLWVPPVVIAVPLIDMVLVVTSRISHRQNPMRGGRDHSSHRLMRLGLSKTSAVLMIYVFAVLYSIIAILASSLAASTALVLVGIAALLAISLILYLSQSDPGYDG